MEPGFCVLAKVPLPGKCVSWVEWRSGRERGDMFGVLQTWDDRIRRTGRAARSREPFVGRGQPYRPG